MHYLTLSLFHYFLRRFYSVLRASDAYALPSSTQISQVPLAGGLTFGLLALAIAVLGAFYLQRRRRRKSALLDARATPPHDTQGDQLSDTPQVGEYRSQPTQPATHESTLSATAVLTTSNGIPESGMPPSHLGLTFPVGRSSRSGEVAETDQATPVEVIEILDEDDEQVDERPRPPPWWDVTQS